MGEETHVQSQELYEHLDDELGTGPDMHVAYVPTSRGKPRFIIYGITHQGEDFVSTLHETLDIYSPNRVLFGNTAGGIHVSLIFDDDTIVGGEPSPTRSLDRIEPYKRGQSTTVNECSLCKQKSQPEYPPLTLCHPTNNPYEHPETEDHHLCIDCSPAHFDDVVRSVDAFGVTENGVVDSLRFEEQGEGYTWDSYDDIDNPYIDDVVRLIEQRLVDLPD